MRPLNDYYHVQPLEMPKKPGLLLSLDNEEGKQIRLARVLAVPKENDLELSIDAIVYVQQHYGQKVNDGELLIKQDYIIAEYTE